jgi:hypothetical protein
MDGERDFWAEARRNAAREREDLRARLLAGSALSLEEAAFLFDIRPGGRCHTLAGYRVTGRRGVLGAVIELPPDAPLFMTLKMRDAHFVAVTDDGEIVYGLMIALNGQSIGMASDIVPHPNEPVAVKQEEDSCVGKAGVDGVGAAELERFFSDMVAAERTWCLSEYEEHLATAGLTLSDDGRRVNVSLVNGVVERRVDNKTALLTILLAFFYAQPSVMAGVGRVTNRSRALGALNWLKAHHPDLVKGDNRYSDITVRFLDETHRKVLLAGFFKPNMPDLETMPS